MRDDIQRARLDQQHMHRALLAGHLETSRQVAMLAERVKLLEVTKKRGLVAGIVGAVVRVLGRE